MERFTTSPRSLITLLGTFALLLTAFFFRAAPLMLDPVRATNTPDQFDTARAIARLGKVLDGTPHPVDSPALQQTRTRLLREISALGYTPEIRSHNVCTALTPSGMRCALVQNIFFRAGPAQGPALLLTAHYDSVDVSPGFGDDGIGLAVWLEVAHLLLQQPLEKPVVFLFTDGEEAGMLGAKAFVDNRAQYGFDVGHVINLEARGVRGPALMFETSHPNAAVVSAWATNGARPFANSMMTAIYQLLPNGTDLTAHLDAGSHGVNIAITDGSELYHSSRDDLGALDRASVQHMGDQALGTARAFLAADWSNAAGGEVVFADVASRIFLMLPQHIALALLVLCLLSAALLLLRPSCAGGWCKLDWRAVALPPALFIGAGLLTFALQQLLGALRPEPAFWTAYPQALHMTIFAATLLTAVVLLAYLAPRSPSQALFISGWFWLLLPGVALSVAIPGFTMIYLLPGGVLMFCGVFGWRCPRYALLAHVLASAFLALFFFPNIQLIAVVMGLGMAGAYAVMEAMVLAPMLALFGGVSAHRRTALLSMGSVLASACVVTLLAPAYSAERPARLNFMAHYDLDAQSAALFASAPVGALPDVMRQQFVVGRFTAPAGFAPNLPARELAFLQQPAATATVLGEEIDDSGERSVRLRLDAAGARGIRLTIPAAAQARAFRYQDQVYEITSSDLAASVFEIIGQSADGAVVAITLASPTRVDVLLQGMWSGLPEQTLSLISQRADTSLQNRMGDVTVSTSKVNL